MKTTPSTRDPNRVNLQEHKRDLPNSQEFNAGYRQGLYYAYKRFNHNDEAREVLNNAVNRKDNWALLVAGTQSTSVRRKAHEDSYSQGNSSK